MAQNLYLNTRAQSPGVGLVRSELVPVPIEFPPLVFQDVPDFNLYLADGEGGFDSISGLSGYSPQFEIGVIGGVSIIASTVWTEIENGWSGRISLNNADVEAILNGETEVLAIAQIRILDPDGYLHTYCQQPIRLLGSIDPVDSGPTPLDNYFTMAETYDRFVQNRSSITGLTGGGSTNLNGITTTTAVAGWLGAATISSILSFYRLTTSTAGASKQD